LMGLTLGLGPALAPTIGGITMQLFGWQALFLFMAMAGFVVILVVRVGVVETVVRDLSRVRPAALARSYKRLLSEPYFVLCSIVMGGSIGALYTQATVLPFIIMDGLGLTPTQFGFSMIMQS